MPSVVLLHLPGNSQQGPINGNNKNKQTNKQPEILLNAFSIVQCTHLGSILSSRSLLSMNASISSALAKILSPQTSMHIAYGVYLKICCSRFFEELVTFQHRTDLFELLTDGIGGGIPGGAKPVGIGGVGLNS